MRIENGEEALFNGDEETALAEFQSAQLASSDSLIQAAALLGIGRSHLLARKYQDAVTSLEKLIADYPAFPQLPEAYFYLAQAYDNLERYNDAAQAYLEYRNKRPGIIDAYVSDLRGDALFAAGAYMDAANEFQLAWQSDSQLDKTLLELKRARAHALAGDYSTAIALYDDLYMRVSDNNTRALIDLRKGEAYENLGQTDQAQTAYLDAVQNYPTAYESYLALVKLVDAGVAVDELLRGLVDYYAGEYGVALAAFDRYLQNNPADPATALYFYGLTTRALGGNQDALGWWDKVILEHSDHALWDEAWEQKAYTQWAFLEQYPEAIKTLLGFVDQAPGHARAAEFLFDAALVSERSGDLQQAAELWERVINIYPNDQQAARALFLAGITHYRLGSYQAALQNFQRYLTLAVTVEDKAAAYFWTGKTQNAMGDEQAGRASLETTAGLDPTGYYSERARDLLNGRAPFTPPQEYDILFDAQAERKRAEDWMRATFNLAPETDLSGPADLLSIPVLFRGSELWRLGLHDEARAEFEYLRQTVQSDAVQSYRLANFLYEIGDYRSSILATRQVLDLAGMDDAMTMSAPIYFNYLRFGTYYGDLVFPLAQQYGLHPLFLFSMIRQESLFDSQIRSASDARGLMQIIPATGADIAGNLGWPENYTSEDLFRPLINMTYGVDYFDRQRKLFDGDLYAALAAYNGGPGNAMVWQKLAPDDPDLFLEVIRYSETRDYIRRIYEIYNIYRFLYNRTP
jgi:soluble lytic murein transglycosylase